LIVKVGTSGDNGGTAILGYEIFIDAGNDY